MRNKKTGHTFWCSDKGAEYTTERSRIASKKVKKLQDPVHLCKGRKIVESLDIIK